MALEMLVMALAAMLSCVTGSTRTACGPCWCYDDHWSWTDLKGFKAAVCSNVRTMTTVPDSLPADIQVLHIHGGSISKLAEGQFKSYRHLIKLTIKENKFSQIEQGALRYATNVTHISLSNNAITELPIDLLTYTPNLNEVVLGNNKIKRLQTNLFRNLKYLKEVWLHRNKITSIEDHCFTNVPQLEEIYLFHNELISLDVNFLDNTISLKKLYLRWNPWHCDASLCGVMNAVVSGKLWDIDPPPECKTPQNLKDRSWSKELQTELCPCLLCQCSSNPSAALCTKPRQLNHIPTDLPTDLMHLNLTGQQIALLRESDTIKYTRLEKLILENNQIHALELHVFNQLKNLTTLSLSNNNLTALNEHQFANLTLLETIDLSHNIIELIDKNCFYNLPSLETVKLNGNKLQLLNLHIIDTMNKLKSLLLHDNPWRCDEALCGLLDVVVRRSLWGTEEVPTCTAPADLRGKHWNRTAGLLIPGIISNLTSVVEGGDLELKCKHCFSSRLVWTFNDVNLPSSFLKSASNSLTLKVKNIRKEQHGYYLCRVRHCAECENDGLYVSVTGKIKSDFAVTQVIHVPSVNSSESCSSHSGLLLLHYTFVPGTELNTTHIDKN